MSLLGQVGLLILHLIVILSTISSAPIKETLIKNAELHTWTDRHSLNDSSASPVVNSTALTFLGQLKESVALNERQDYYDEEDDDDGPVTTPRPLRLIPETITLVKTLFGYKSTTTTKQPPRRRQPPTANLSPKIRPPITPAALNIPAWEDVIPIGYSTPFPSLDIPPFDSFANLQWRRDGMDDESKPH